MTFTEHPRLLARAAGAFYLIITAFALFAYMHVRGQLIDTGDMARTADNIVANEHRFRIGFTAAVIVTICNLPLGFILYELFKVVNLRLALLALVFIISSLKTRSPCGFLFSAWTKRNGGCRPAEATLNDI